MALNSLICADVPLSPNSTGTSSS